MRDVFVQNRLPPRFGRRPKRARRHEQSLREQTILFRTALNNMSQGLCMFDGAQRLVLSNERYATLYGLSPDEIRPGMHLWDIIVCRATNGISPVEKPDAYLRNHKARLSKDGSDNRIQELADGRLIAVSHRPMPDGGWLSIHDDITKKHRIQQRIAHVAHHDPLTDLPNRLQLREHLEAVSARVRRGDAFALFYLDLDRFKHINDSYGHAVGDELLKAVAGRLQNCIREIDLVARIGGDEFVIVQTFIETHGDTAMLAKRIIAALTSPFAIAGLQLSLGTTVGIALSPADGTDPDELITRADLALCRGKVERPGEWSFFKPEMEADAQWRRSLSGGLSKALAKGQMELYYRPILDAGSSICCFEALPRWRHPERGLVLPAEFMPAARENGLIRPLSEWIVQEACATAKSWPDSIKVAVNLSPAQFKGAAISELIRTALAASDLPARRLELEITESLLRQSNENISCVLHELRALGVRIVVDHFGTGYFSVNSLLKFPIDKVKIDRSLTRDITKNSKRLAIVRAIASLGPSLGITIAAEGIEDIDQLEALRHEGCQEMQGCLISPPLPKSAIDAVLSGHENLKWHDQPVRAKAWGGR